MSPWIELSVGLAKALAWPGATIYVAWILKAQIPELFNRVEEISLQGAKFAPKRVQDSSKSSYAEIKLDEPEPAALVKLSPAAKEMESHLRNELKRFRQEQHVDALLGDLARARLQIGHEITYRRAFGSQLTFLRELNATGAVPTAVAKSYFEKQTKNFSSFYENYGFEGWLNFLKFNTLISNLNDKVEITSYGNDFVQYLASQRLSEAKQY